VLHSSQILVSHTSRELFTTQVPQRWTQMLLFGKELPSMMVRYTVRRISKTMPIPSRNMERTRRLQPTLEFLMHQLWFNLLMHQLSMQVMIKNSHILMVEVTIIQVPQRWTQINLFGKELPSMMVRYMVRKSTKIMQMISRNTERTRRLQPTLESHMHQP